MKRKPNHIQVFVPHAQRGTLEPHELKTAEILSLHFRCEVSFISVRNGYKVKTPDVQMGGQMWELKSPTGDSKRHTIKKQLKRGKHQSRNIVIDSGRTSLEDGFIKREILKNLQGRDMTIHHLVLIDKNKKVHILK